MRRSRGRGGLLLCIGSLALMASSSAGAGTLHQTTPEPTGLPAPRLSAYAQLMPQGLRQMLRHGLVVGLDSSLPAAGFATVSIPQAAARRAGVRAGRRARVIVGRGTISSLPAGVADLRLRLRRLTARRLARLHHVTMTIQVRLVDAGHGHVTLEVTGRY